MRARAWILLGVLAPAASVSCVEVRYRARDPRIGEPAPPATHIETLVVRDPHRAPGIDDRAHDEWARPKVTPEGLQDRAASNENERTVLWEMRIQAGARTEITDMTWSPASAPRCAGGHPALDILVDDVEHNSALLAPDVQVHWERPVVVSGEHVVGGRFDEDVPLLHAPSVVDVHLVHRDGDRATEECVRVPATGPEMTYWNQKRWSVGARVGLRFSFAFSSIPGLFLAMSVGRWVGPVRLGFEPSLGATDDITFGGAMLEASGIAWRGRRWGLGWSLGFESMYAHIKDTPAGSTTAVKRSAASLGPRLGLQLVRAAPDIAGVSRVSPTSAWGFELFAAAGRTVSGDAADGDPVTMGVALLGF